MQKAIETKRTILRSFTLDDAEDVFEYASDSIVTKYLTWETHKDMEETINVIKILVLD